MYKKTTPLPFNINDVANAETVHYNNDTNINDVSSSKSAQIATKKLLTRIRIKEEKENLLSN